MWPQRIVCYLEFILLTVPLLKRTLCLVWISPMSISTTILKHLGSSELWDAALGRVWWRQGQGSCFIGQWDNLSECWEVTAEHHRVTNPLGRKWEWEQGMPVSFVENFPTVSLWGMELQIGEIAVWAESGLPALHNKLRQEKFSPTLLSYRGISMIVLCCGDCTDFIPLFLLFLPDTSLSNFFPLSSSPTTHQSAALTGLFKQVYCI